MSNTYRIRFLFAFFFAAALTFSGGAQAQDQAATQAAVQVEAGAAIAPPLSITQRYVPAPRGARAPLQLLIGAQAPQTLAQAAAPSNDAPRSIAAGDIVAEVGAQPAINALSAGRLAITVSNSAAVSTTAASASQIRVYHGPRPGRWVALSTGDRHE